MSLVLDVKLKDSRTKFIEYRNVVPAKDPACIVLLLKDLESCGVPVVRVCQEF